IEPLAFFFAFVFALALDDHGVFGHFHRDLVALHAGQICADGELVVLLKHVNIGSPHLQAAFSLPLPPEPAVSCAEVLEHPLHLIGHALHRPKRTAAPSPRRRPRQGLTTLAAGWSRRGVSFGHSTSPLCRRSRHQRPNYASAANVEPSASCSTSDRSAFR